MQGSFTQRNDLRRTSHWWTSPYKGFPKLSGGKRMPFEINCKINSFYGTLFLLSIIYGSFYGSERFPDNIWSILPCVNFDLLGTSLLHSSCSHKNDLCAGFTTLYDSGPKELCQGHCPWNPKYLRRDSAFSLLFLAPF